jgi:imidazoleglycerol phosphate synthase glutamine amidotransferase subunit HisH
VEVTVRDPALRATAGASVRLGGSTSYQYNYDAIVMPQTGAMSDFFTPLERSSVTMRTSDASSQRPLLLIVVVPLISALGIAAMKKRA